ncbi:8507_t:CDS:2 [Entrophospora sp. SA101]|nr:8507_t:CDS:2 [Entrophospora sp. SA101]
MPVLRFNFAKENAQLAKAFVHNLDNQAETFDIEEKQGFADKLPKNQAKLNQEAKESASVAVIISLATGKLIMIIALIARLMVVAIKKSIVFTGVLLRLTNPKPWKDTTAKNITPKARRSTMLNLYQKLQQIQSQTGAISKSELNKFQNYRYFTEQQALNILKPLLAEQKLTLTFADDPNQISTEKPDKDNSDPAKAKGCAETYAIKYFLTKFFLIPTTDELDPDVTKSTEHLNRLKNGQQETPEAIQKRLQTKDQQKEAELKAKYGAD